MGVTKAALDAECLALSIRNAGDDFDAALARYDRERRLFGNRIIARARRLGAYIEAQQKPAAQRAAHECQPPPEEIMREIGSMAVDIHALTA